MSILYQYYNNDPGHEDAFDSSFSISIVLIVLSLILGLGFIYGFSNISQNSTNAEASLESGLNITIVEPTPSSQYPEPGTLSN